MNTNDQIPSESVIEINPKICGGYPVLKGTRITVSQILGEIADGRTINDIAYSFDLELKDLRLLLLEVCNMYNPLVYGKV